ncbi:MAG: NAD(P)H dehydrogenase [Shinella sp.]|nr:MAG: NAD(P)H dehydrogenase [Shinella sp.]
MHVLLVLAHPLPDSFAAAMAATVKTALEENGHSVDLMDLYREGFDPRLTESERRGYFDMPFDSAKAKKEIERLQAAEALVLVFPQWWFNFPAVLKGFFDRAFAPGVAFLHDLDGGRIRPGLTRLRHVRVFTTTGSPWWVVRLYMGDPVRRLLKRGIVTACTKGADFRMLALHDMDRRKAPHLKAHLEKIRRLMLALT